MSKIIDLVGQRFGRLTVESFSHMHVGAFWNCRCECGTSLTVSSNNLRRGNSKSCGCLSREITGSRFRRHGMSRTRLHRIWGGMLMRCSYEKNGNYDRYGGRGISVCQEWQSSFESFRDWAIANGYRDDLTIDRIDSNGNYEPGNCRWEPLAVQARNTSGNRRITHNGETRCLAEWAEITGLKAATIRNRIEVLGWSIERALLEPANHGVSAVA